MIRRAAAAAAIAIAVCTVALSGCSATPSTPKELAAAKAQQWREAAYGGDQARLDALYCGGKASWDTSKVKDWPGDENSKFDAPVSRSDVKDGLFTVTLRNPEWGSAALVNIKVSGGEACVDTVTSPG